MHEKGSRKSQTFIDDGSGKVEVWRIEHFDMVPIEEELHGQFFAGDSYVVLYTYYVGRKECYIVYFWQGQVIITCIQMSILLAWLLTVYNIKIKW